MFTMKFNRKNADVTVEPSIEQKAKKAQKSAILSAVLYLALGILLICHPEPAVLWLCYTLGAVLALYGIIRIVSYLKSQLFVGDLLLGIATAAFGIFTLLSPTSVLGILSVFLGLIILVNGFVSLQRAFTLKQYSYKYWYIPMLLALLVLALGALVIAIPTLFGSILMVIIGILLVYEGISDLWMIYTLSKLAKDVKNILNEQ